MAKKNILAAVFMACLLSLPLCAQQREIKCYISDPDMEGKTNIREKPGGKVVYRVDSHDDCYMLTAIVQPGGWWKIKSARLDRLMEDETITIPSSEAWIHRSVLGLRSVHDDGHFRILRTEPRTDAPRAGIIRGFNELLRPLDLSPDGKWVKVSYEPFESDKLTGWIEVEWTADDRWYESGDGYGIPMLNVYTVSDEEVSLRADSGKGKQTSVLKKGKAYWMQVAKPADGWWEVVEDCAYDGFEAIQFSDYSWVPASSIRMRIISPDKKKTVPVYSAADGKTLSGDLKVGTEVHPLDLNFDDLPMVRIASIIQPGLTGWVNWECLSAAPAQTLAFADIAGTYETQDGQHRIVLRENGSGSHGLVGYYDSEFETYFVQGNWIYVYYVPMDEVAAYIKPTYIYDPDKKTLVDQDGATFYLQAKER